MDFYSLYLHVMYHRMSQVGVQTKHCLLDPFAALFSVSIILNYCRSEIFASPNRRILDTCLSEATSQSITPIFFTQSSNSKPTLSANPSHITDHILTHRTRSLHGLQRFFLFSFLLIVFLVQYTCAVD